MAMCMPPPPEEFKVDHPFIFVLLARDAGTANVLFAGRVLSPKY